MQSNMKTIVLFLAILGYVQAITYNDVLESEWNNFRKEFGKIYENEEEVQLRKQIFQDNKEIIDKHNRRYIAGEETYEMGVNQYTDLLPKESRMLRARNATKLRSSTDFIYTQPDDIEIPSSIDWRTKGAVTPVRNQGDCLSCWAFAAVATLEGINFVKTGNLIPLSEQNLIDCSNVSPYKNFGCDGGFAWEGLRYVMANGGIATQPSYPYRGKIKQKCQFNKSNVGATVRAIAQVRINSELDLAAAVALQGPISVAIYASNRFIKYRSGVFNDPLCIGQQTNHDVVVVGYGHDNQDGDYWIVKNSFGSGWGESGYIRMSRNKNNQCQIASEAVFPLV